MNPQNVPMVLSTGGKTQTVQSSSALKWRLSILFAPLVHMQTAFLTKDTGFKKLYVGVSMCTWDTELLET